MGTFSNSYVQISDPRSSERQMVVGDTNSASSVANGHSLD